MLRLACLIFISICSLCAKEVDDKEDKQIPIGNFSLSTSQQIGPLIGVGQNIVDKHDFLVYTYLNQHVGTHQNFTTVTPSILYGFSDKCALLVALPIAAKLQQNNNVSRGVRDMFTQIEYAVYNKDTKTSGDMVTVLGNIFAPTGKSRTEPEPGFGAPAFTLGFTASHQTTDWYCYTSGAATFPLSDQGKKIGNIYFYQAGIGRNIGYESKKWLAALLLEMSGWYKSKNKVMGQIDPNSGSHQILLMPSLFFSTTRLIFQIGVAAFPFSHYFGNQNNTSRYYFALNVGWKF